MHCHSQNLTDGKLPIWRHGRAWLGSLECEWNVFRDTRLLLGKAGRWQFSIYLRWFSLHMSLGRQRGGLWEVSWHDGALRFEHPWIRQNEWRRDDSWWRKAITLNVRDWLLGRQRYETTKGVSFDVVVPMPEGCYSAKATQETRIWRRRWYVPMRRCDHVWLDIDGGIPYSGKGENSWDCGDDGLWGTGGSTLEEAIGNAVASVLTSRRRHGHDSKGTGREPVMATVLA